MHKGKSERIKSLDEEVKLSQSAGVEDTFMAVFKATGIVAARAVTKAVGRVWGVLVLGWQDDRT